MLPKANRITKKKDFEKNFKKGVGFKEKFLILKISPAPTQASRFAFIVSQKVSKKATVRNKIKRQLRELIKTKMNKIKKGIDGVFIVLPGAEDRYFQEMADVFGDVLKKANLI